MSSNKTPRPQIALFGANPGVMEALALADAIDWLWCCHEAERTYRFARADMVLSRIDLAAAVFDLPDLLAIIGVADRDSFDRLAVDWQDALPASRLTLKWLDDADPEAVVRCALYHVSHCLTTQRAYDGRMALELANYRREFERLQRSFTALESYVAATSSVALRDIFDYPQSNLTAALGQRPDGTGAGASLQQLLPLDSLGLAAISIAFSATQARSGNPVEVTLSAIESGQIIAVWSLPPAVTTPGWAHLALERAIEEPALSLVLSISCEDGSEGWMVVLGPPHPYPEFCARMADGKSLAAPLAMRVQTTLPGSRVPDRIGAIRPAGTTRSAWCLLSEAEYATVKEVFPGPPADGDSYAHYNRELGFIQVHPRGGGTTTIARLLVSPPAGVWRLSTEICLAHQEANPTLFGVLVRQTGDGTGDLSDLADVKEAGAGFSGWTMLAPMQKGILSTVLPPHPRNGLIVCLMTRQDAGPEFGWARFSEIRLHYLPTPRSSVSAQTGSVVQNSFQ